MQTTKKIASDQLHHSPLSTPSPHPAAAAAAARTGPGERRLEPGDVEPMERAIRERSFDDEELSTLGVSLKSAGQAGAQRRNRSRKHANVG